MIEREKLNCQRFQITTMEVQIVEEQENELLERTEIEFVVVGEETPERLAVRDYNRKSWNKIWYE